MPEPRQHQQREIVRAEPGTLSIDLDATFERFVDALATGPANELRKALEHRQRREFLFAHAAGECPSDAYLDLTSGVPPTNRKTIWDGEARKLPTEFAQAGFSATYTSVLDDFRSRTYTTRELRQIGVVSLEASVAITAVTYPQWAYLCLGLIEEPDPGLACRTGEFTLPAGQYLICEASSWGSRRIGPVCQVDRVPTEAELESVPGVRADRIIAACDQCRSRWIAERASLEFHPTAENIRRRTWDYATASGHANNRVSCPVPMCTGRVAFTN